MSGAAKRAREARRRAVRNWGIAGGVLVAMGVVALVVHNLDSGASAGAFGQANPSPTMAMDMAPGNPASHGSKQYPYAIGDPGPGAMAPEFALRSTAGGGTFDLAAHRGQKVLLYFMEGLTCQPCFDQITAIQKQIGDFNALGIQTIVAITNDPYTQLQQKADDMSLSIGVLADEDGSVSMKYTALRYGMMMGMNPGHTFILVGTDGTIMWRADYGGPPKYTMYLPPSQVISDMKAGMVGGS